MFSMTDVTVCYDNVEAVRNVSLSVEEGQIVTVIGPNGAGKTTLLMAAIGLLASSGRMVFQGNDIGRISVEDRVERRLCLVPEKRELFSEMSVADNLLLGSYSLRDRSGVQTTLDEVYDRFPRLRERQRQAAGTLSGGERQMLALGRALMAKPKLLMLDEPSLGLAPLIVREIFRTIASLRGLGVSILLVEQNARAALETADFGYVLETGEIVQSGPAKDLIHDPKLISAYLGGHLVYGERIGVNHAVVENPLEDFVAVLDESDLKEGKPKRVAVQDTKVMLVRRNAKIYALAETCSHLGGPLSEGQFVGDTVKCPWHGSTFSVVDGSVVNGPATFSQPCFETRIREGKIEIKSKSES